MSRFRFSVLLMASKVIFCSSSKALRSISSAARGAAIIIFRSDGKVSEGASHRLVRCSAAKEKQHGSHSYRFGS